MTAFTVFQILSILLGVLMWTLVGQGLLVLLLGARRESNIVYRFFSAITSPVLRVTRAITPRIIMDAHIGFVAFFLLLALRIGLYMLFYSQGWIPSLAETPQQP